MHVYSMVNICMYKQIYKKQTNLPPTPGGLFNSQWRFGSQSFFLAANTRLFFRGISVCYDSLRNSPNPSDGKVQNKKKRPEIPTPLTLEAIQRIKKASLPDGTKFSVCPLEMDPHFQMIKEVATQKSEDVFKYQLVSRPP